ncbi:MAG: flippase-like domain-containing protein, partial [Rhodospirillaceae bacterium]|nr:flippase-like domain-containing protein [Rhodospirillaceae bacterium]
VGIWRMFSALMAGYFSNHFSPVRISPLVRAWLVAKLENISTSSVLATITIDRIVDGFVFVALTFAAVAFLPLPEALDPVRTTLTWGAAGSLAIFIALSGALIVLRRKMGLIAGWKIFQRLPERIHRWLSKIMVLFAEGIILPDQNGRRCAIILAAIIIKLFAASHLFFAGLGFGVELSLSHYLFAMIFLGYLVILAGSLKIIGGFTAGAIFLFGEYGIDAETALAMVFVLKGFSFLTVAVTGASAIWYYGLDIKTLVRRAEDSGAGEQSPVSAPSRDHAADTIKTST